MVSTTTINTEIANIKSLMAGGVETEALQCILNELQFDLVIATAGAGPAAAIGAMTTSITTPKGKSVVGANLNEPIGTRTKLNSTGNLVALVTLLGIV